MCVIFEFGSSGCTLTSRWDWLLPIMSHTIGASPAAPLPFPSLPFLALFVPVLLLSWLLRRHRRWRNGMLLVASYIFYSGWDPVLAGILGGASVATFWVGRRIGTAEAGIRGWWTGLGVSLNILFLAYFKYAGFFLENLESLAGALGLSVHLPILEILLPLGISFITFQNIAYLVDIHRGYGQQAKSVWDYLLFISFFPQLLIGPICRSRDLLPQIEAEPPEGIPDVSRALSLLGSGVLKKVVLATYLQTHLVDDIFLAPENYGAVDLWFGAYAYTIMIYFDFSGYTDMARGIGLLLGFELPENFDRPYRSTTLAAFWRRWHMTFGNWLRDYIYFSLGGGKRAPLRVYLNLMVTLVIAGFWHGAHWKFVIWGGIHGLGLVGYRAVQDVRRRRGVDLKSLSFSWWYTALAWAWTFHLVVLARVVFKSGDLEGAGGYYAGLLPFWSGHDWFGEGVEWLVLPIIGLGLAMNFWGHHWRRWFIEAHERLPSWAWGPTWAIAAVALLSLQPNDVAPFLYFQF